MKRIANIHHASTQEIQIVAKANDTVSKLHYFKTEWQLPGTVC